MIYGLHFTWPLAIPDIVLNYVPDGVWAYALMSAIHLVWNSEARGRYRHYWVLGVFLAGPILEVLQWYRLIPGHGDALDVVVFIIGGALSLHFHRRAGSVTRNPDDRWTIWKNITSFSTLVLFTFFALATSLDYEYDYVDIRMHFEFNDSSMVMENLNRFALLDWNMSLTDRQFATFHLNGLSLAGLGSDTISYAVFTPVDSLQTFHVDSLLSLQLNCRILNSKMGIYREEFD